MASIWVESIGRSLEQALEQLAVAVRGCRADLWETAIWHVPGPGSDHQFLGPDWKPITDRDKLAALSRGWVERRSTPWSVAWHALESLDYDLTGEFGPWAPPPPFTGHPHWRDLPDLPRAWSQSEILDYLGYCKTRARAALAGMTEEKGSAPLPPAHRYRGQPHAWIVTGLIGHTTEHASQIQQFSTGTAAGL